MVFAEALFTFHLITFHPTVNSVLRQLSNAAQYPLVKIYFFNVQGAATRITSEAPDEL